MELLTLNAYEVTYIINPALADEEVRKIADKYSEQLTSLGGQVENTDFWGKKRLAYEIEGKFEGHYICMKFKSDDAACAELRRVMKIDESIVRSLFIRLDPK